MNIFTLFGEIAINHGQAKQEIISVEQQADRSSKRMQGFFGQVYNAVERVSEGVNRLGQSTMNLGKNLTLKLTAPITAVGALALNTAANFETSMNRVRALTGATGQEFASLEQQAMDLGLTTQFSASQAADAMGFLSMAGFKTNEILGAMPSVLQLAASAQLDMARAADITTNILTGYGMEVDDLARANDVLVKAFISSNTNLEQLGQAFKFAGPVAKAAGIEFEETVALLAMMGNAGIQASMAGTSLRGAITRLLNPTKQISDILDRYNVRVTEADGKMRPLVRILEDLANANLTAADATLVLGEEAMAELNAQGVEVGEVLAVFGQRAGPGMQALMDQGIESIDEFIQMLRESGGTAEHVANVQMEGLGGATIRLKSAWEGLMLAISRSGPLSWATNLFNTLAEAVSRLAQLNPEVLRFLTIMGGILAGLGPVLIVFGTFAKTLGTVLSVIGNIRLAMLGLFSGPAAPFVIALGILSSFGYRFLTSMEEVEDGTKTTLDRVMSFVEIWGPRAAAGFQAVVSVVGDIFNDLRQRVGMVLESIGNLWFITIESIGDTSQGIGKAIVTVLAYAAIGILTIWDTLKPIFDVINQWLVDGLTTAWEWTVKGLDLISDVIIPFILSLPGTIAGAVSTAWNWTVNQLGNAWDWLKQNWDRIVEWADDGLDMVMEWAIEFAKGARELWDQALQLGKDGLDWLIRMYQEWTQTVEDWSTRVTSWVVELYQRWAEKVEDWVDDAVEWTVNLVQSWAKTVEGWYQKAVEWTVRLVQEWTSTVEGWAEKVVEWTVGLTQEWAKTVEGWYQKSVQWTVNLVQQWATTVEEWRDGTVEWVVHFVQVNVERIQGWLTKVVDWTARITDVTIDTLSKVGRWFLGLIEGRAEAAELEVTVKAEVTDGDVEFPEEAPKGWGTRLSERIQNWINSMDKDLRTWVINSFFNLVIPTATAITIAGLTKAALEKAVSVALAAIGALKPTATGALGVGLAIAGLTFFVYRMFFAPDDETDVDMLSFANTINDMLNAAGIAWMTLRITKQPVLAIGAGLLTFAIKKLLFSSDDAEVDDDELRADLDRQIAQWEAERAQYQEMADHTMATLGRVAPGVEARLQMIDKMLDQLREQRSALEDVGQEAQEAATHIRELTNAEKLFIEALRQGASLEAAGALMGIGYWETRGLGGFVHTDPRTGGVIRGGAGEFGMMQIMPETGLDIHKRILGLTTPFTPEMLADIDTNIQYGVAYFLAQLDRYQGDIEKAISAYNAGTATAANKSYVDGVVEFWKNDSSVAALIEAAQQGAENLMDEWVKGLRSKKTDVEEAVQEIAQIPEDYLMGHSPPKNPPLSEIGEGAENVAATWVDSFLAEVERINPEMAERLKGLINQFKAWSQPYVQAVENFGKRLKAEYKKAWDEINKDHVEALEEQLAAERESYEKRKQEQEGFVATSKSLAERFYDQWKLAADRIGRTMERFMVSVTSMWVTGADTWDRILSNFLSSILDQIFSAAFAALGIAEIVSKALQNMWNPLGWLLIAGLVVALSSIQRDLNAKLTTSPSPSDVPNTPTTPPGGDDTDLPDLPRSAGRQIAEITGATRDVLVDLLSPLARLDEQTGILQRIHSVLDDRLPKMGDNLALAGSAGVITFESGAIVIQTQATDAAQISDELVWELERKLGEVMVFKGRGGG